MGQMPRVERHGRSVPPPEDVLSGVLRADRTVKGRGAVSNRTGRFERLDRVAIEDGWEAPTDEADAPERTTLMVDTSRSIIARNTSPDVPFDRSINPYRGCEHGCIYCFARPSHAYLGFSPGRDFETQLFHKPDAAALLRAELAAPGYRPAMIALGANTDPYQPVERRLGITRQVLEVLSACRHPVGIVTKSALVARDIDLLAPMAADRLAMAAISVTTLDRDLARVMEPRAPTPSQRLEAIRRLARAGIPVAVLAAPMIPGLNDHELERILEASAEAGAVSANWILVRLPLEIAGLFEEWLRSHRPARADRVLSLLRSLRGGRLNDPRFGHRHKGEGPLAQMLEQRFQLACQRLGLASRRFDLDVTRFRPPPPPGAAAQLDLFG